MTARSPSTTAALRLLVGALSVAAVGPTAIASVLEIADDGSVQTIQGPTQRIGSEVKPILPRPAAIGGPARRAPSELASHFESAGAAVRLSPALVDAVAWVESRYNVSARSPKGAMGVMQLMPGTASDLRVDPNDPAQNVAGGAAYLRQMLEMFNGDVQLALAAYNAGPAAVKRYGGVPPFPETQAYVARVLERLAQKTGEK